MYDLINKSAISRGHNLSQHLAGLHFFQRSLQTKPVDQKNGLEYIQKVAFIATGEGHINIFVATSL